MPTLTGTIGADGALVSVEVGIGHNAAQALRAQSSAVPPPLPKTALLDTGAERTTLDGALASQLRSMGAQFVTVGPSNAPGLAAVPGAPAPLAGWTGLAMVLSVRLVILYPQNVHLVLRDLLVDELPLAQYDLIIGRDVLAKCDLHYRGRTNAFELVH